MSRFFCVMAVLLACPALGLVACEGGGTSDVKAPFESFGPTTVASMVATLPGGTTAAGTIRIVGEKEVGGRVFQSYKVSMDPVHPQNGIEIWIDKVDDDTFVFVGYEEPGVTSVVANQPYTVRTDGEVGANEIIVFEATATSAEAGTSLPGKATFDYVKVSDDETVDTAFGTLSGVKHFAGTVTLEGEAAPALVAGYPLDVEMWYHPSFGLVKSSMPTLNLGLDMKGEGDCGDPLTPGYNTIQKVGLIQPGGETFSLATYDCSGDFNADKMTHAKMLLELRLADEQLAKTGTPPQVNESFVTVFGYFPHQLVASTFSIFHPEENGQGYTYWYALVDQASKNTPGSDGISYGIEVAPASYMTDAVRATARIQYMVIDTP
ncbi:MAG TPA: hypothetical protein PKK50_11265 [Myxococcota bacterium]|nr:hypothetical protein [Myxococcota bacterium]